MLKSKLRFLDFSILLLVTAMVILTATPRVWSQQAPSGPSGPSNKSRTASFSFAEQPADAVFTAMGKMFGVPFRAAAPLTEPVTIDSRGQVNLEKAVTLLDEALTAQGQAARLEDGVVKISPRSGLLAVDIEVIVLKHSDPASVAKVVQELFRSRDVLTELADKDPKLLEQLLPQLAGGVRTPAEALKVEATPWEPLNAVIVKAPKRIMPIIRRFIETSLDEAEGVVKAAIAKQAAEAAKRKAEADKKAAEAKKKREEEERRKKANQPPPPPEVTKTFQPSFVTADYISEYCRKLKNVSPAKLPNNVLMYTTRKYEEFDAILEVMDMLDVPDSTSLQQYYIPLKHATAREARDLLVKLFSYTLTKPVTDTGARKLIGRRRNTIDLSDSLSGEFSTGNDSDAESASDTGDAAKPVGEVKYEEVVIPVGEVTIVSDERNNALIIRTLPANMQSIRDIIERIDRPTGQVLIEVFIAELTLDDQLELGIDFVNTGITSGLPVGERSIYTTGQDFGLSGNTSGFTYSLISNNLNLFIRALKTSSRLDVVSRPSITTLDNTAAVFEFGSQVPLIQASNVNISGEVISSVVRYEQVGNKLQVTPHINEAGFITMKIEQTIDEVSDEKFTISEQLEPQLLIKRMAKTNVRVFDGQTVFLGGFIDDKIDVAESMVPFLGDIPWLGELFKSSKKVRTKTELLIFITPHIVSTPSELMDQSDRIRRRSSKLREDGRMPQELQVISQNSGTATDKDPAGKVTPKAEAAKDEAPRIDAPTEAAGKDADKAGDVDEKNIDQGKGDDSEKNQDTPE